MGEGCGGRVGCGPVGACSGPHSCSVPALPSGAAAPTCFTPWACHRSAGWVGRWMGGSTGAHGWKPAHLHSCSRARQLQDSVWSSVSTCTRSPSASVSPLQPAAVRTNAYVGNAPPFPSLPLPAGAADGERHLPGGPRAALAGRGVGAVVERQRADHLQACVWVGRRSLPWGVGCDRFEAGSDVRHQACLRVPVGVGATGLPRAIPHWVVPPSLACLTSLLVCSRPIICNPAPSPASVPCMRAHADGDKDTFRAAFHLAGTPRAFYQVPHPLGLMLQPAEARQRVGGSRRLLVMDRPAESCWPYARALSHRQHSNYLVRSITHVELPPREGITRIYCILQITCVTF